jgi:sodium-dependent phosphate cotransporter
MSDPPDPRGTRPPGEDTPRFPPSEDAPSLPPGEDAPSLSPGIAYPEVPGVPVRPRSSAAVRARRVLYIALSLYLFIFALILIKDGAAGLEPFLRDTLHVDGVVNAVGFGWLFAYVLLSGSPVAATSLAFFDQGVISMLESFGMIVGGFVYVLRGHERASSLSLGVLAFLVTATTQSVALVAGSWILSQGIVPPIQLGGAGVVVSVTDRLVGGLAGAVAAGAEARGGSALVFVIGLGVILVAFSLFDRALPPLRLERTPMGAVSRLVYRPVVMFTLGMLVTLISMSVSVSLSLLVPLSARGYVRQENLIPYIMGANITTFVDTLIAALLINNPEAFSIVLVQMATTAAACLLILLVALNPYEQGALRVTRWVTRDNRSFALFMVVILVTPILLLVL